MLTVNGAGVPLALAPANTHAFTEYQPRKSLEQFAVVRERTDVADGSGAGVAGGRDRAKWRNP